MGPFPILNSTYTGVLCTANGTNPDADKSIGLFVDGQTCTQDPPHTHKDACVRTYAHTHAWAHMADKWYF